MNTVVLAAGGQCPIAPGATLDLAISLLQMSVLGLPLLLSLFQFVNAHEYPEPEEEISKRTMGYGIVMMTSALMLWGFYYTAFCIIRSNLGSNTLTTLLFLFMWVMLAIIGIVLLVQLEQMVGAGLRYSLTAYLVGLGLIIVTLIQRDAILPPILSLLLGVTVVILGLIKQFVGFEEVGRRAGRRWEALKEQRQADKE